MTKNLEAIHFPTVYLGVKIIPPLGQILFYFFFFLTCDLLWELVPWQDQLLGKKGTIPFNFIPFQWVFADHNCVLYAVLHSCFHPEIPVTTKQTLINREKGSFLVKVLVQHMFMECLLYQARKTVLLPCMSPFLRLAKSGDGQDLKAQTFQGAVKAVSSGPDIRLLLGPLFSTPVPPDSSPQCCPLHLTLPLGLHFPS